jgi:cytochrome c oxidase subunit I+III
MLFSVAFIVMFILGGITGVMIAAVPFNWQVHDTHFIVAHFHYTMVGGTVFPIFGAIYYWFPKVTGRMLSERLGRAHFWLFLIGFNATFLLMHVTGIEGMPRRVYTYFPDVGWTGLNLLSTIGAAVMGLGVLVFCWNAWYSWRLGAVARSSPWDGRTLEWSTSSPPDNYNFLHVPLVASLHPVRDGELEDPREARPRWLDALAEARGGRRENIVSDVLAAEPQGRVVLPMPSPWPFWTAMALSIAFIGVVWTPYLVGVGLLLTWVALIGWHWPEARPERTATPERGPTGARADAVSPTVEDRRGATDELPADLTGTKATVVWGVLLLVAIEATVVVLMVMSAFYLRLGSNGWPPAGVPVPDLTSTAISQGLLAASIVPAWLGMRALAKGHVRRFLMALPLAVVLAIGYLGMQAATYASRSYGWDAHVYGSMDWTMSAYAAFHVVALILAATTLWLFLLRDREGPRRLAATQGLLVYWLFAILGSALFDAARHFLARW